MTKKRYYEKPFIEKIVPGLPQQIVVTGMKPAASYTDWETFTP
jgi:hypothetical protein